MINRNAIVVIQNLLDENTPASLIYAALECRLALERVCYERLRLAHDYISHEDIVKWQPKDIVNKILQDVDSKLASDFTMEIAIHPQDGGSSEATLEELRSLDYVLIGNHVGFDPKIIGKLWNGLSNLALHTSVPRSKDDVISCYGDSRKIREKVKEALAEISRIDKGNIMFSGVGMELSFDCNCGTKNKRRKDYLKDGKIVNCINPNCEESFVYCAEDSSFVANDIKIPCKQCERIQHIPMNVIIKLKKDQCLSFTCEMCNIKTVVEWRLAYKQEPDSQNG